MLPMDQGRMFIVEQTGKIRIYKNGELLPKPFLDITNMVEQGTYKDYQHCFRGIKTGLSLCNYLDIKPFNNRTVHRK